MKLVPCNEIELRYVRPKTNLWAVLNEFAHGYHDVMEVTEFTNKNAESCASSMSAAVKRYRFNIQVIKRGERVFLVRKK